MAQLMDRYRSEIQPALKEQLGIDNIMRVPKIEKVTLNMGVGDAVADRKIMENAVSDMTLIAGQKPIVTNARKSEAGFKIREGWPIGCKVTLRGRRMYEFIERLISIAIPRMRDFRGLNPRAFDGRGSFSMGVTRADHLPGDRLRQDRQDPWAERDDHDHGDQQRRRPCAAQGIQLSVQELVQTWQKFR